ncbi:MAG TPA: glycoside hydrolase family 31 protein [Candidatus Ruania gallistercoris]|uniref:Glycoside hydrolase family 31 protein n=1 Tax=Candidatus Ruania gallistercoris TaxID=2838746 RepID=A0A9D2ED90_9MICO|nr:glycoside hydrolase family 31 protein [Candidatus Ruania gallistercoris]
MSAAVSAQEAYLVRSVTEVRTEPGAVRIGLEAFRAVSLPGTPGWLTGESMADQGIETEMPNLPRGLQLPPLESRETELRVSALGTGSARVVIAPAGGRVLGEDADWLGIVTTEEERAPQVTEHADRVELDCGGIRLLVHRRPFALEAFDTEGRRVLRTAERLRQVAGFPMAPPVLWQDGHVHLQTELAAEEDITGFGEQFSRLVKNGQRMVLRAEDALGTGTGRAYKPIPVWHSTAGYTALLNTGAQVVADVGHERPSVLSLQVPGEEIDLVLTAGPDPRDRLREYTEITGRATIPPLWAFGYWMGRCRYHSAEEMLEVARSMRSHQVPCDVLHLDPDWLVTDRLNTDFIWNTDRFGDQVEFVAALAEQGCRLSVWELPYLDPHSPRYAEAAEAGYLVRTAAGEIAEVTGTPTPDGRHRALIDFTNPAARRWWQRLHEDFLDDGVAVFKTDFGEGLPDDAALADGTPAVHAHNLYPLLYNRAVSEHIGTYTGRAPLVWGRSGWAGSHRYPGQWGGDAESTVAGLQATLRGGLSYALSAPGFWSHDIGGFFGPELTPGLYVRWTQLGALSPLMRAHGLRPREPWAFGEQALAICRDWIRLRYSLLPYLWQVAHRSAAAGLPMLRPLALEFPGDRFAATIDDQFLLGDDLLVVPILDDGLEPVTRSFYVPEGEWVDLVDGSRVTGPGFHTRTVSLEQMPVLVRAGAVLPRMEVAAGVRNTDELLGRPWVMHAYGSPGTELELTDFDGAALRVQVQGTRVTTRGEQPVRPEAVLH